MTELLFLPALTQDAHAYDLLGLPGRAPVYPGHGDRPPVPVTLAGMADEIASSLTEPVDVVGVALGGIVGQYLLIRRPDLVRSAVLANTPSGVGDPAQLLARADDALRTGVTGMTDALLARWFRAETVAAGSPGVDYIRRMTATISPQGFAFMQRAMAGTDTAPALPSVAAPVTLVQGVDDPVGAGSVDRIAALLPLRRTVRIPGSHMVHLDNPVGFREVIEDHLAWVAGLTERTTKKADR